MGLDANIKAGDRVVFAHRHAGWGGDVAAGAKYLIPGATYTVQDTAEDRITSLVTRRFVVLEEVESDEDVQFISTQFERAKGK